jgi:peptidoglycan/xylan/chitin deacetylase (PgdA/CDA1 family)
MRRCISFANLLLLFFVLPVAAETIVWPGKAKVAISLSYDDALASQLDNVVPALDKYQIKASFYPTLSSPVLAARMDEWRKVALSGHELGNHTLFHPCSASKPGRSWVLPRNDLDKRTLVQIQEEVATASAFLKAIDGRTQRTYTPTCLDTHVADGNYLEVIAKDFVAIKTGEGFADGFAVLLMPDGQNGKALIDYVKKNAKKAKLIHILFHGVGGDYMTVAPEAHEQLLKYLADNRDIYWTDTYINIMTHFNKSASGVKKD